MAKLTKQELKNKISENIQDDELVISLLEDIEDSVNENNYEEIEQENKMLKEKYEDLKNKYRDRFLNSDSIKDTKIDELEEKKIIDVKEI